MRKPFAGVLLLLLAAWVSAAQTSVPKLVAFKLALGATAPDLKALSSQLSLMPPGPDRTAMSLVVKAATLPPKEAAQALLAADLKPEELAAAVQVAARSWGQTGFYKTEIFQRGRSPRGTAPAFEQLREALVKWDKKPQALDDAAAVWAETLLPAPPAKPYNRGKLKRLAGHVFDVDDNLFMRLPTKIFLFHKVTGEELEFSTEDYAKIRPDVGVEKVVEVGGRALNLADFERRFDSFRDFRDPPDGNNFIGAVKWIVENLPESEWQGPSFKAFVRALSNPETARHVAILTARKHRPESFIEAFEYLKDLGYIARVPPLANVFPVGDAPNTDTAGAKAEVMKGVLDRYQATPIARDAKEILDQDGRHKKRLHTVGFSDDDRDNFERMAKELTAVIRRHPERWAKVKITLFYTGKGRKLALVLTARGGRRLQRVTERAEPYTE